jgi:hypothetical protein
MLWNTNVIGDQVLESSFGGLNVVLWSNIFTIGLKPKATSITQNKGPCKANSSLGLNDKARCRGFLSLIEHKEIVQNFIFKIDDNFEK